MEKTRIGIPKGWMKMRAGTVIQAGDRFWAYNTGPWLEYGKPGHDSNNCIGRPLGASWYIHIRRIAKPRKASARKKRGASK